MMLKLLNRESVCTCDVRVHAWCVCACVEAFRQRSGSHDSGTCTLKCRGKVICLPGLPQYLSSSVSPSK